MAYRVYRGASLSYGWSMITVGSALIGMGLLVPHL